MVCDAIATSMTTISSLIVHRMQMMFVHLLIAVLFQTQRGRLLKEQIGVRPSIVISYVLYYWNPSPSRNLPL